MTAEAPDLEALRGFLADLAAAAVVEAHGDFFAFYDPTGGEDPKARQMPFVTLVTGDRYDAASRLDRPGVFRLNIGVSEETAAGYAEEAPDFTALDRITPHPVYASAHWLCVLNPQKNWPKAQALILEAHGLAKARFRKRLS